MALLKHADFGSRLGIFGGVFSPFFFAAAMFVISPLLSWQEFMYVESVCVSLSPILVPRGLIAKPA